MAVVVVSSLLNLIVPVLLLVGIAWRPMSRAALGSLLALFATYFYCIHHMGSWHVVGLGFRWVVWVLFGLVLIRVARHGSLSLWWPLSKRRRLGVALTLLFVAYCIGGVVEYSLAAHEPEVSAELDWPLQGGIYAVVQGGSGETINHHHHVPAQRFGLDIVQVDRVGLRARRLLPHELEDYRAFDNDVLAPCAGRILRTESGMPDNPTGTFDEAAPAGNYVAILCEGRGDEFTVLLAHLRRGSVRVRHGEQVKEGTLLGSVGNSGNTTEPHLHLHAVKGEVDELEQLLFTAEGISVKLEGRYLLRNDVVDTSDR